LTCSFLVFVGVIWGAARDSADAICGLFW
jgi:hypothetical protein